MLPHVAFIGHIRSCRDWQKVLNECSARSPENSFSKMLFNVLDGRTNNALLRPSSSIILLRA